MVSWPCVCSTLKNGVHPQSVAPARCFASDGGRRSKLSRTSTHGGLGPCGSASLERSHQHVQPSPYLGRCFGPLLEPRLHRLDQHALRVPPVCPPPADAQPTRAITNDLSRPAFSRTHLVVIELPGREQLLLSVRARRVRWVGGCVAVGETATFADTPSPSILKNLFKREGGAAE